MISKIKDELRDNRVDSLWITDTASIDFLIGVKLSVMERFVGLLITPSNKPLLVVNDLFPVAPADHFDISRINDADDVVEVVSRLSVGDSIAVDKHLSAGVLLPLIKKNKHVSYSVGSDYVDKWRAIKSQRQIELMKKASQINDSVMALVPSFLKLGVTELEVASRVEQAFFDHGADGLSFETIVAFGEQGADPHAVPTNRQLKANETIIIDMGCIKDGYCSDMTRTFISGENLAMKGIYDLVNRANKEAMASIHTGMTFSELDAVARNIIKEGGYITEFNHRLGHGIGQEVHEPYDVSASNNATILPGMCFSIEPGIYIEGVGGVRIENLVYVDEFGKGVSLNYYDQDHPNLPINR